MSKPYRIAVLLISAAVAAGCQNAPRASGGLDLALDHYEAHRYHQAHQQAVEVAREGGASAAQREQATYLAGLAAFRAGDFDEAELRLLAVTSSSDPRLLGSSQAMLGQLRMRQRRAAEAAVLFEAASLGLSGEDARQARRFASIAHHEAGNFAVARQLQTPSGWPSTDASAGFTLQVGAFSDRGRADHAAAQISEVANGHGLGPVNVRQTVDSRGRPLYLVQFGHFPTRQAAAQARSSLGRLDYIIALHSRGS